MSESYRLICQVEPNIFHGCPPYIAREVETDAILQASDASMSDAKEQLGLLIKGFGRIVKVLEFVNPGFALEVQKSSPEAVPRDHWDRVITSASLTVEQLRDTLMLDILCSRIGSKVGPKVHAVGLI